MAFPINNGWVLSFLHAYQRVSRMFLNQQTELINQGITENITLVGGFNPSEKYESQLGWLFPIYGKMFQTTNQIKHYKLYLLQDDYLYTWYLHQYLKFYLPKKGKTTMQLKHTETQCARTWGFHMCEPPGDVSTHLCMYVYIYIHICMYTYGILKSHPC